MIVHLFPVLLGCMHGLAYGEGDGVILDKTWACMYIFPMLPSSSLGVLGHFAKT